MNHGRVEQLDEPSKIYSFPKNRFVADFIGTCNILDAEVVRVESGRMRLRIDGLGEVRFADSRTGVLLNWRLGADPLTSTPRVFSTSDGGLRWRAVTLPQLGAGFRGVPFFLDPDQGWLLATRPGSSRDRAEEITLWHTVNGGRRWETLLSADAAHPVSHGVSGGDQLVAVSFQDRARPLSV